MGYEAITLFIMYWKSDQTLMIHRDHNIWFYEYTSRLYIEDNHTPGYLLLQQYLESVISNLDLLNLIPCELDIIPTPFSNTKILTYKIDLPSSGNKIRFNLLDDEYFTIPYFTDTIPNSSAGHQLPTLDKRNLWIISVNGEDPITDQGALDELNCHQISRVNTRSRSVNTEGRSTIEHILKIFVPYLIQSYL